MLLVVLCVQLMKLQVWTSRCIGYGTVRTGHVDYGDIAPTVQGMETYRYSTYGAAGMVVYGTYGAGHGHRGMALSEI